VSSDESLLRSLYKAVESAPQDVALRVHLAELLLGAGRKDDAVAQLAAVLQLDPANTQASRLMSRALSSSKPAEGGFDWLAAENQLRDAFPPRFDESSTMDSRGDVGPGDPGRAGPPTTDATEPLTVDPAPDTASDSASAGMLFAVEHSDVRLADVGGMTDVKNRLNAAFLAPMRSPKLGKLYAKSLRGGLLLYGPPGCGKTFLAKAVAGELGARFIPVTLNDVLDMWVGNSEKNMHELFRTARANAPCVLFFDELDAVGQKRSQLRHSAMRGTVNQLLTELDGVNSDNDGVFALGATNHPWDVDQALLRPGRFDRAVAVLPPDDTARRAILEYHLRERPVAGIKLAELVRRTEGFSGADLAHLCDTASERALLDSIAADEPRMIGMPDLVAALSEITPSTDAWFGSARNVALYANSGGFYNDLIAYMKKRRLL
jgi:ATP-dependent 26S proteasome regulatory subunit